MHCERYNGLVSGTLKESLIGGIRIKLQNGRKQILKLILDKEYMRTLAGYT
jgi:hypothetical protein